MEQTNNGGEAAKRPVFLTVLCILSFVAAGLAILAYVAAITAMGLVSAASSTLEGMEGMEGVTAMSTGPSAGMTWAYIIVGFITVIISLFGVIKMWKLQKSGFMLYVGATVVSLIMTIVYTGFAASIMGIVFSALFIVLYGLNLKHLK